MANVGLIPALVGEGDLLVSDALNHASIVDGARLSRARVRVFPHGDVDALDTLLEEERGRARQVLVIVDGLYSMDGDLAPLREISAVCRAHDALLAVDDAHGTGSLGANGRGSLEHLGLEPGDESGVDVVIGTLGKALGSFGAFVAGSHELRELLVNTARSFIFSCALSPPQAAAAVAALEQVEREPWRRWLLQQRAAQLRSRLARAGISTAPSTSHIVPVVIGGNRATMRVCQELLERGFYAQGIRHPSVPAGSARLRITPMASHSEQEIDQLADEVIELLAAQPAESARAASA
jgi:8-amino-7-oxononanoate synthase